MPRPTTLTPPTPEDLGPTTKLFVYGIFLGEGMRESYNMTNPQYATVSNFVTVGNHIVQAEYIKDAPGLALTGLLVDVPIYEFDHGLDALEGGYERVRITTENKTEAYMYARRGTADELGTEDHSLYKPARRTAVR